MHQSFRDSYLNLFRKKRQYFWKISRRICHRRLQTLANFPTTQIRSVTTPLESLSPDQSTGGRSSDNKSPTCCHTVVALFLTHWCVMARDTFRRCTSSSSIANRRRSSPATYLPCPTPTTVFFKRFCVQQPCLSRVSSYFP